MSKDETPYEVGYGKPPVNGKFAKGQSGNPKGRPKGSKNFATVVLQEARQRIRINGPRGTRTVTKLQAGDGLDEAMTSIHDRSHKNLGLLSIHHLLLAFCWPPASRAVVAESQRNLFSPQ